MLMVPKAAAETYPGGGLRLRAAPSDPIGESEDEGL